MAREKPDLVYGTLDMLILKALQDDPRHGLAIADRIQQMSKEILRVEQGSLYPALYRLEAQGSESGQVQSLLGEATDQNSLKSPTCSCVSITLPAAS